jgi:hypothetical protein
MSQTDTRLSLVKLSVEEENLAAIPFAVLERRMPKGVSKLEVKGTKILPDGQELRVVWQVQGNNELGLPTEQDLDIFVALGVLTFQSNFQKTVTFSGREIARILNISGVHGKFYQRLKLAMDRFIPLRFRALAATDRHEDVKWVNVFQEASFSFDRETGRCTGSVTWNDKVVQSMNAGFFRLLDASRYMELDGITAKHLYRYLTMAFEKTDVVLIDARTLLTEHLGVLTPPKYLSRLMQTLEPAFEQLIRIEVLGSFHIVSSEEWRLALRRHPNYVPESKSLLEAPPATLELQRTQAEKSLLRAGFAPRDAATLSAAAVNIQQLHTVVRAADLASAMREEGVMGPAAVGIVRKALEQALEGWMEELDWCEIAVEICRQKKNSRQSLKNPAGLLIRIARDIDQRDRLVNADFAAGLRERFRLRERAALEQIQRQEERTLVLEYEHFRHELAEQLFQELSDQRRQGLQKEKLEQLKAQERFDRLPQEMRDAEVREMILQDIARQEAPRFEKWLLRRRAEQAVLPLEPLRACQA